MAENEIGPICGSSPDESKDVRCNSPGSNVSPPTDAKNPRSWATVSRFFGNNRPPTRRSFPGFQYRYRDAPQPQALSDRSGRPLPATGESGAEPHRVQYHGLRAEH